MAELNRAEIVYGVGIDPNESDDSKMAKVLQALDEGLASGIAPPGVFARVRARAGLPPRELDFED